MTACSGGPQYVRGSDYSTIIERARISDTFNGREELRACVRNWDQASRLAAIKALDDRGYFRGESYIFVEVGNAGFGGYGYIYVGETQDRKGVFEYSHARKDVVQGALRIGDYYDVLRSIEEIGKSKDLFGDASKPFDDGACYFVNINSKELSTGFAVYGPIEAKDQRSDEKALSALKRIMELVGLSAR